MPNLDVLPCGPTPPNPAELLHTDRFHEILAQCRRDYDKVVLDSPPTAPVTAAAAERQKAVTDLLARWAALKGADLATLNAQLTQAGLPAIATP